MTIALANKQKVPVFRHCRLSCLNLSELATIYHIWLTHSTLSWRSVCVLTCRGLWLQLTPSEFQLLRSLPVDASLAQHSWSASWASWLFCASSMSWQESQESTSSMVSTQLRDTPKMLRPTFSSKTYKSLLLSVTYVYVLCLSVVLRMCICIRFLSLV